MMIQKNLKNLERMEVLILLEIKREHLLELFLRKLIKWKVFRGVFRTHSSIYDEAF